MILNSGLDAACIYDTGVGNAPVGSNANLFTPWVTYAAIGSGSTAPAVTDTILNAQVGARSNSSGGFGSSRNAGLDAVNNVLWAETTFTRVFSVSSNVNATEWGLAAASTGNLSVRELFRADPTDNSSSPVTLTLEDGDQLQLVVTQRVQADWVYASKSFVITGTAGNDTFGTHTGNAAICTGLGVTNSNVDEALAAAWPGGIQAAYSNSWGGLWRITADASATAKGADVAGTYVGVFTASAYVQGAFHRDYSITIGTSAQNGDHYGWVAAHSASGVNSANRGLRFALVDPAKLTKENTHRLTLTVRKSIARL